MRTVQFLPAAIRDFDKLDHTTQRRVTSALARFAETGLGDIKRLRGRTDFRLRVGKWRVFFHLDTPGIVVVTGIDNRGQAY